MVTKKKTTKKATTKRTRKPKVQKVEEIQDNVEIPVENTNTIAASKVEEIQVNPEIKDEPVEKIEPIKAVVAEKPDTSVLDDIEEPVFLWKKLGGGSLYLHNRIIKPNQIFEAKETDLPKVFMDTLEKVGVVEGKKKEFKKVELSYKMEEVSEGLFNVVNRQGKPLNETPLDKNTADALLKELL